MRGRLLLSMFLALASMPDALPPRKEPKEPPPEPKEPRKTLEEWIAEKERDARNNPPPVYTTGSTPPPPARRDLAILDLICPTCNAGPGQRCIKAGNSKESHRGRLDKWRVVTGRK